MAEELATERIACQRSMDMPGLTLDEPIDGVEFGCVGMVLPDAGKGRF